MLGGPCRTAATVCTVFFLAACAARRCLHALQTLHVQVGCIGCLGAQVAQQRGLLRFVHRLREPHTASRGIKIVEAEALTACPSPTMPACMAYVSTVTMMLCSSASVR